MYAQPSAHLITAYTYLLTYLLTPWCRVLLEKLPGLKLVKKFPAFHGTRKFITALTGVRHLSLSWTSPIQSIYPHLTSWRSILILSTHLRLGLSSGLLPSGFPTKTLYTPLSSPIRVLRLIRIKLMENKGFTILCTMFLHMLKMYVTSFRYLTLGVARIIVAASGYICDDASTVSRNWNLNLSP